YGRASWIGTTTWRRLTPGRPLPSGPTMILAGSLRRLAVVYPISKRYELEGRALVNWVAQVGDADDGGMPRQDREHTARMEDVLEPFASYVFDFVDVPSLIRGPEVIYHHPMVDPDPLPPC